MKSRPSLLKRSLLFMVVLSVFFTSACGTIIIGNTPSANVETALPAVKDYQNLVKLLKNMESQQRNSFFRGGMATMDLAMPQAEMAKSVDGASSAPAFAGAGGDYSTTNVQVQGVDEADIVKTDGRYIYQVHMNQVIIAEVRPANQMKIVNTITATEDTFYPSEIYLDDKYLVVIGNTYRNIPMPLPEVIEPEAEGETSPGSEGNSGESPPSMDVEANEDEKKEAMEEPNMRRVAPDYWPYYQTQGTVKVMIYNIEVPESASMVRDFEMEGYYVSSRKIGAELYLLTNRYIYYYAEHMDENTILPWYRDSAVKTDFVPVSYDSIRYFPDGQDSNYLLVAGLDLNNIAKAINVEAYLGSGQTVYASLENLYVTVPKWTYEDATDAPQPRIDTVEPAPPPADGRSESSEADRGVSDDGAEVMTDDVVSILPMPDISIMPFRTAKVNTQIYRFALKDGTATFAAKGEVPGSLLNQFSMDEHNGYFRVATTVGDIWRNDAFTSNNNLYVLDNSLNTAGKIENIAPGERIYSVRFMGDRGYMVTFKTVDPLFVIDLKNPRQPKILGELKIPGYSDYLHPYDENHIIGFGMDAIEAQIKNQQGDVIGLTAYPMGMKVAMFDVSDVANPVEKFGLSIGDRGTYSELLHNHKALLFSRERNLMAFPVTLMEAKNKWEDAEQKIPSYGELTFQGMHVYQVDSVNGFSLIGRISHLTPQEIKDAPRRWFDYQKTVERGLYIEDTLYTLSKAFIKAHSLDTFEEQGSLKLPYDETQYR